MQRRRFLSLLAAAPLVPALVSSCAAGAANSPGPGERPNIVILYADDLGYGDLSSYGAPDIKTPAIDAIGARGVRFTRFYANAPECTPSRTALLTGRYQQRVGGLECAIGNGNVGRYDEAIWLRERDELGLPASETTIAQMLRDAGYATAIFGKWHLGYDRKFGPNVHGFDEAFVTLGGGTDYVAHTEPDGVSYLRHNGESADAEGYLTDVFADKALAWLQKQGGPYFLYVPFTAPHNPFQAPGDGPEPIPWDKGDRETYRTMVERLDQRVGDIVAAINRSPQAANTIIVFLSDNGAPNPGSNTPWRGYKGQMWEGGIRVPCLMCWPAGLPAGRETAQVALNMDLTASLLAAAGASPPPGRKLDGIDLRGVLTGEVAPFARTVFWRYKRNATRLKSVMQGELKLMIANGERTLVDLATDPAEERNLIAAQPEKAAELERLIDAWEREVEAPRLREFKPAGAATPR